METMVDNRLNLTRYLGDMALVSIIIGACQDFDSLIQIEFIGSSSIFLYMFTTKRWRPSSITSLIPPDNLKVWPFNFFRKELQSDIRSIINNFHRNFIKVYGNGYKDKVDAKFDYHTLLSYGPLMSYKFGSSVISAL